MGRKGIVVLKRLKFRLNEPSSYEQKFFEAMAEIPRHAISFERDSIVSKTHSRRILEIIRETKGLICLIESRFK